jgi:hypothetical protein
MHGKPTVYQHRNAGHKGCPITCQECQRADKFLRLARRLFSCFFVMKKRWSSLVPLPYESAHWTDLLVDKHGRCVDKYEKVASVQEAHDLTTTRNKASAFCDEV